MGDIWVLISILIRVLISVLIRVLKVAAKVLGKKIFSYKSKIYTYTNMSNINIGLAPPL